MPPGSRVVVLIRGSCSTMGGGDMWRCDSNQNCSNRRLDEGNLQIQRTVDGEGSRVG